MLLWVYRRHYVNKPEEGALCAECHRDEDDRKPAIVSIGEDKTPLCAKHFEIFMEGFGKLVKRLTGMLGG